MTICPLTRLRVTDEASVREGELQVRMKKLLNDGSLFLYAEGGGGGSNGGLGRGAVKPKVRDRHPLERRHRHEVSNQHEVSTLSLVVAIFYFSFLAHRQNAPLGLKDIIDRQLSHAVALTKGPSADTTTSATHLH